MKRFTMYVNPATILALAALVFAVTGGAYAASGDGDGHVTASVAKKKSKSGGSSGKPGPRGPAGPAGPAGGQGPAGPQGAAGATGAKGETGAPGTNGTDGENGREGTAGPAGKSVAVKSFKGSEEPAGADCNKAGGASFEVETTGTSSYLCNGLSASGGGTLQAGELEHGVWSMTIDSFTSAEDSYWGLASIGLPRPFASEPKVEFIKEKESSANCPKEGEAKEGYLCIYTLEEEPQLSETFKLSKIKPEGIQGPRTSGVVLKFVNEEEPKGLVLGTWTANG